MGAEPNKLEDGRVQGAAILLAGGLPFIGYLTTTSAHGYWFDAGEFIAASINLGIAHPPGQPLSCLIARLFAMLPLGPLALRVALASAALAAVAAAALYCAVRATIEGLGESRPWITVPLSVGASWFVAGSHGWWFQAVRPEVYALQAALTCLVLERIIAWEAASPAADSRPLVSAALLGGLALTNHHFMAVMLLPAVAPTAIRIWQSRGSKPIVLSLAACLLGLAVYVYLPIRASAEPLPNLGDPNSPGRFLWMVSAQAFIKNTGSGVPQPLDERFAGVAVQLVENLGLLCLIAAAGLYAILRTSGARRIGAIWTLVLLVTVAARAWLGFVPSNPDALGYLLPAFAAIGALSASFVAALTTPLGEERPAVTFAAGAAMALIIAALGAAQLYQSQSSASLARFDATDDLDELNRRELPPRALVLAYSPHTIFASWGAEGEDRTRPDLILAPMPFLTYPGMIDELARSAPESRELLVGYLLHGDIQQADLESVAGRRPVFVELDARLAPSLYRSLAPAGLLYQALAGGSTITDERVGARAQRGHYQRIYAWIGEQSEDPPTKEILIWHHFNDALYYLGFGDRASARAALQMATNLQPQARSLDAMREALNRPGKGPIDVEPFRALIVR